MGKLHFTHGVMGAGKTRELIIKVDSWRNLGYKVIVLKPCINNCNSIIKSRNGMSLDVDIHFNSDYKFTSLDTEQITDIVIDEAQFLTKSQVNELHRLAVQNDINVHCYGIRTDFRLENFDGASRLMLLADVIEELESDCEQCSEKASAHIRYVDGKATFRGESIVDKENHNVEYKSVCWECYYENRRYYEGFSFGKEL